ncbi:hypothetical protein F4775DRAFT_459261 [Biscogniauxia sp. FL1348]|nr:hypothetical protein F4775DRAFT_459261 [Biscogniauxia sp. FL1348]
MGNTLPRSRVLFGCLFFNRLRGSLSSDIDIICHGYTAVPEEARGESPPTISSSLSRLVDGGIRTCTRFLTTSAHMDGWRSTRAGGTCGISLSSWTIGSSLIGIGLTAGQACAVVVIGCFIASLGAYLNGAPGAIHHLGYGGTLA